MADNVQFTLNADSTPPNGTVAATDELSDGSHAGIAKLAISADGDRTFIPATAADGLLVNLGTNNDVTVTGTVSVTEPVSVDDNGGSLTVDAPLATPVHTRISDGTDVVNVTAANALVVDGSAVTQPISGTVSVTEPVSVDDNGGSLTVDAPLATPVHTRISDGTDAVNVSAAGALQVDGSAVTQPVSAASLPLPTGAATAALQLPDGHNVTVDNGAGAAAVNIQDGGNVITVDGTVSVTEPVSVDDNGGSLTVDAPLATPVHTRISDGTDAVNVSAAGALQVDGSAVTQPVSVSSLPNEGQQTMANSISVAVASDQSAITVAQATAANLNAQVVGTAAHAAPTSGNPVYVAGRASTAVPTDVGADGDAAGIWLSRNGAPVVTMAPHVGLMGLPWSMTSETAQYSTTQTSTVLVAGGASDRIVVTSIQIQAGGTTAGTLQVYFGTGAYARGTNLAIFDGEFAPSATLKPGVVMQGPFIAPTNGDDILVTDSAAINPLTITVWYYVVT